MSYLMNLAMFFLNFTINVYTDSDFMKEKADGDRASLSTTLNTRSTGLVSTRTQMEHEQAIISLENFDRESQCVHINEKASVEALLRIGCNISDLNYKPKVKFIRPGCDNTVTNLLYNRYEQRRQKIIQDALEMRLKVLEEKNNLPKQTPFVRITMKNVEKERKNLKELMLDTSARLRKIVLIQLRELFSRQVHQDAVERTNIRISKIEEDQKERTKVLHQRQIPKNNPQEFIPPPPPLPHIDLHMERLIQKRKEEAEKRKEYNRIKDEAYKAAHERAEEHHNKTKEEVEKKINNKLERFMKWQASKNELMNKRMEQYKSRSQHESDIMDKNNKMEEEKRKKLLDHIAYKETRAATVLDTARTNTQSKINEIKNRMASRMLYCNSELERQREQREIMRKQIEERDADKERKINQHKAELSLALLQRKLDRDEKTENILRQYNANNYAKYSSMLMTQQAEENELNKLSEEQRQIQSKKFYKEKEFTEVKNKLVSEFATMDSLDDIKALKRIRKLLDMTEDEMNDLIELAKFSAIAPSSPSSSLTLRPRTVSGYV